MRRGPRRRHLYHQQVPVEFYELESGAVDDYRRAEGYTTDEAPLPTNRILRRLWLLFEYPDSLPASSNCLKLYNGTVIGKYALRGD